jgi:hypothetical protein
MKILFLSAGRRAVGRRKGWLCCMLSCLSVILLILTTIQFTLLANTINKKNGFQDDSLAILPSNPTIILHHQANHLSTAPFSFSACLIIKDDNIILPEWLAYHYTVLPLHRLIVGVDTLSHTDPTPILDAYQQTLGMNITTWKNDSFWKDGAASWSKKDFTISNSTTYDELRERKRHRQNVFYEACLQQLHDENRTWTMLIDADEYLSFNYYDDSEKSSSSSVYNASGTRSQLDQSSSATMADVIQHWDVDPGLPCVTFARYVFVSTEKDDDDDGKDQLPQQSPDHPTDFNTTLFNTLRYRQRVPLTSPQPGKSIVDASRYDGSPIDNPHRIKKLCTASNAFPDNKVMPFRVHHYVGSWEAFRSPGFDPRGRSYFDKRNNVKETVEDSTMSTWLDKFVTLVGGRQKAIELTQRLRLHAELEMERKIMEQQQQQLFDWDKLNTKSKRWE